MTLRFVYCISLVTISILLSGKCVVKGKASKNFCPHILKNGFLKYDEMKSKLLVNFDPSKCFLEDIMVRMLFMMTRYFLKLISC